VGLENRNGFTATYRDFVFAIKTYQDGAGVEAWKYILAWIKDMGSAAETKLARIDMPSTLQCKLIVACANASFHGWITWQDDMPIGEN
jgi:hypothetical protein